MNGGGKGYCIVGRDREGRWREIGCEGWRQFTYTFLSAMPGQIEDKKGMWG